MNKFETLCVQAGYIPKNGEPRVLPLNLSTTYVYDTPEELAELFDLKVNGHIYSRISNPTVSALEEKVSALEGGVASVGTASGMSAIAISIFTVCKAGDNFISTTEIYGGTYNLFTHTLKKLNIECRFVKPNASIEEIEKLIDDKTKIIYGESIANPGMTVLDFDKFAEVAHKYRILFMVDNTLTTPFICKPFKHGVNVSIHASTKYLDGHAAAVGGIIVDGGNFDFSNNERYKEFSTPDDSYHGMIYAKDCGKAAFAVKARVQMIRDYGMIMSPMNAYLTNLGSETLHVRMERHSENAMKLAKVLKESNLVEWIRYPGLENDENHALANKYFEKQLYSGMLTIGIKGGREAANRFMKELKLFKIVTHIADVRSCVLHPATTTHRQLSDESLIKAGIYPNLVRLSVGIENIDDIVEDIVNALKRANK